MIGVPYTAKGPGLMALKGLVQAHRPKLLIINSILHSPTDTSLLAVRAFQLLRLAEQYGLLIAEGDIYDDLAPPGHPGTRLASLDQPRCVIYLSSFSKTFTANLHVGFITYHPELARNLADGKLLTGLVTSGIIERVFYKILTEGHYRKHVERIRARLNRVCDGVQRSLERMGLKPSAQYSAGMFLWVGMEQGINAIARAGHERGYVFAPGGLFSPSQIPSMWMRFNIATSADSDLLRFLVG